MSNNCSISQIERSSEVNIAENAFSMFGSHAPQNDDNDLSSLSYCDYEYQRFRCRRDFAPPGICPPRGRSLVIWPSPGSPFSVFEVLISYILLGSKTTAERSAISIHAPIIRDVVNETHL